MEEFVVLQLQQSVVLERVSQAGASASQWALELAEVVLWRKQV